MSKNSDATVALLEKHFDIAFAAPDGIKKLRELILSLAVQGKLVPQDPSDKPASELLKEIEAAKNRLIKEGKIKQSKPLPKIKPEELPYELPKSWEWVKLNHVFDVRDGTHDTPKYVDVGYPLITSKNLYTGVLSFKDIKFISEEDHIKINERSRVDIGDILFAMIGSIGNPVIVECAEDFSIKNVALFKFYSTDKPSSRYLHYFLKQAQESMRANSSGAVQNFVSLGFLRNYLFPLPPLAEQRRIVAKIDELMARCDELERLRGDRDRKQITVHTAALNRLLIAKEQSEFNTAWQFITQHFSELYSVKENVTELRKAILQLAVMGKLVPQDPNDQPASELLNAIKLKKQKLIKDKKLKKPKSLIDIKPEEVPYELPNSWQWSSIQHISLKVTDGEHITPQRSESGYYLLSARNVTNQGIKLDDVDYVPKPEYERIRKRCDPEIGDILVSCSGSVGRIAIVDSNDYVMVRSVALIKHEHSCLNSSFLEKALKSPLVQSQIVQKSRTTAQSNLFLGKINEILIPIPPLVEQQRIVAKIDQLMALCDNLEKQIDAANSKQTNLLNAVMTKI